MRTDFLIIGSGVAGLFAAHKLAAYGEVTIITKKSMGYLTRICREQDVVIMLIYY